MATRRRSQRGHGVGSVKVEVLHHDSLHVCRLCLKQADNSYSNAEKVWHIVREMLASDEVPDVSDQICPECCDKLQAASMLRKRIKFTNSIWTTYKNRLRKEGLPLDPFVLEDEAVDLHCHVCSTSFSYDDLLDHIPTVHGVDHLGDCKFCETLLDCQATSNVDKFNTFTVTITEQEEIDYRSIAIKEEFVVDLETVSSTTTNSKPPIQSPSKADSQKPVHGCPECDKTYTRRDKLKEHLLKSHQIQRLPKHTIVDPEVKRAVKRKSTAAAEDDQVSPKSAKRRPLTCRECNLTFSDQKSFRDHFHTVHDIVDIIYELPAAPICHQEVDTNQKPYSCHICENSYAKNDKLVVHLRQKHKVILMLRAGRDPTDSCCKICSRALSCPKSLNRHMKMCHNIDVLAETKKRLEENPTSRFVCPTCGKTWKTMSVFDAHLLEHSPLPFTCSICEVAAFAKRGERREHEYSCFVLSTTSGVTYKCVPCASDVFDGMDKVKAHRQAVHGGGTGGCEMSLAYSCSICRGSFEEVAVVLKHFQEQHKFTCRACDKSFDSAAQMKSHQSKSHTHSLMCTECGQILSRADKLLEHMWTHTGFACNVCKIYFATRKEAQEHRRLNHQRRSKAEQSQVDVEVEEEGEEGEQ